MKRIALILPLLALAPFAFAEDPATNAHGPDAVHPEIRIDALVLQIGSPTNRESAMDWYYRVLLGADPASFPEAERPAVACYRGTLDAVRAAAVSDGNAYILGMPSAVFGDGCKAEVSLLDIDGEPGKPAVTNGVRLSVRPLVCRGGTPLLRLTAEASVFAGDDTAETEELGLALEPGAAAVFAPPPAGDCRVLVLLFPDDSWLHAADPATNAPAATPAAAFATNAPAATLEQLLAEPWRLRLSPEADPVAEMRKIATLDAFVDTRVLFLGPGVCVTRLRNDPGHIAYARAQSRLVRYLFRGTRPAAGVDFARGGSSRLLAFDALPREGDPEFPRPVRAVPFEFDAFAPADAPEDLVVRLPGEDRWVRVPGLGEVAMPRLSAADPATNAPAATLARAEADLQGETFERWRFTIRPDLVTGRPAVIDGLMAFLGRPSIWWPPGSSMERSGDDGFVVLNTRENLDTIRMILGELSVNVDRGEPVVLEDSPATNAPDTAASDCARFLESAFREIDPGTNGAPAAVVLGDLGWDAAIKSSDPLDSAEDMWLPKAGERIVITDTTELTLLIGKHQFVRIARLPLDTSLPESLDEKDRAVADAVGGPLLVVERRENYSSFGHAERNVAIRHYILPTGAREGHPFHPPAGAPARFLFADLAPAHAEPVPHAESAESEPHAESAETAEP